MLGAVESLNNLSHSCPGRSFFFVGTSFPVRRCPLSHGTIGVVVKRPLDLFFCDFLPDRTDYGLYIWARTKGHKYIGRKGRARIRVLKLLLSLHSNCTRGMTYLMKIYLFNNFNGSRRMTCVTRLPELFVVGCIGCCLTGVDSESVCLVLCLALPMSATSRCTLLLENTTHYSLFCSRNR